MNNLDFSTLSPLLAKEFIGKKNKKPQSFISEDERKGLLFGSLVAAGLSAATGRNIGEGILKGFSGMGSAYIGGLDALYKEREAKLQKERIEELIEASKAETTFREQFMGPYYKAHAEEIKRKALEEALEKEMFLRGIMMLTPEERYKYEFGRPELQQQIAEIAAQYRPIETEEVYPDVRRTFPFLAAGGSAGEKMLEKLIAKEKPTYHTDYYKWLADRKLPNTPENRRQYLKETKEETEAGKVEAPKEATALQQDIDFLVKEFNMTKKEALQFKKTSSGKDKRQVMMEAYMNELSPSEEKKRLAAQKAGEMYDAIYGLSTDRRGVGTPAPIPLKTTEKMPSASQHKGRVIKDTVTGKRYKSDGTKWVEIK